MDKLKNLGIEAVWDTRIKNTQDERLVADHCQGYDFVIAGNEKWGVDAIEGCRNSLKLLVRYGIGFDSVDIGAATRNGIPVAILPGCNAESVAEQAIALMLDVQRKISYQDRMMRS